MRLVNFLVALSFCSALAWTYVYILSPLNAYLGFTYEKPNGTLFIVAMVAAVAPAPFLPLSVKRPGDFILWIVYYGLHIPAILMPVLMGTLSERQLLALVSATFAAYVIIALPPFMQRKRPATPLFTTDAQLFWTLFALVYGGMIVWVLVAFGGHLRLASIQDIYTQRSESDTVLQSSFVGYATGILGGAMNPFLMALGLVRKKWSYYGIGAAGQVLVYATSALKGVMLTIVLIPFIYFLLFRKGTGETLSRIGYWFVAGALALLLIYLNIGHTRGQFNIFDFVFSVVYTRTFCMPGVLLGAFTEYFMTHPITYYSHVNIIGLFVHYPYAYPLGNMVGRFLTPDYVQADTNANFLATDGVAALSFPGIVIAGLLFRICVLVIDTQRFRRDLPLVCCAVVPSLMSFLNSSVFTTVLTGGFGVLTMLLYGYTLIERGQERSESYPEAADGFAAALPDAGPYGANEISPGQEFDDQ